MSLESILQPKEQSRKRAVIAQAFGGYFNTAIQIGQGLILIPLYIHFLGPRLYGFWLSTGSLVGMLSILNLGIGGFMIQRVAAAYGKRQYAVVGEYFINGLLVYLALSALFVGVGMLLSYHLPTLLKNLGSEEAKLRACFQLALVAAGLGLVNECLRGFSNALLRPAYPAFVLAGARIAGILLTIVLLDYGNGLWAIPIGMLVTEIIALCLGLSQATVLIRRLGMSIRISIDCIREYLKHGSMLFVSRLSHAMTRELDPILITYFLRPEITAAYMITRKAADIVFQLLAVIYASTHGAFSHLAADGNTSRTSDVAAKLLGLVFFTGLLGFAAYVAFNDAFVTLWVGSDLLMSREIILMIGAAYFLSTLRNMVLQLLNGLGEFSLSAKLILLESLLRTVLAALLLKLIGVEGVPLSIIFATGLMVVMMSRMLKKNTASQIAPCTPLRAGISALSLFGFAYLLASQLQAASWLHLTMNVSMGMIAMLMMLAMFHFDILKNCAHSLRKARNA